MWKLLTHFLLAFSSASALIAYDCQNRRMNITTFSLSEIVSCKTPSDQVEETEELIQLVQLHDVPTIAVFQCKIHVTRYISRCGIHAQTSAVENALATYIYPTSRAMCLEMHQTRQIPNLYGKTINQLILNGTTYATAIIAGKMTGENSCDGAEYEDHKGRWKNVIVQVALEITLHQRTVPARISENQIVVPGGDVCPYKEKTCIDSVYGYTFWEHMDESHCTLSKYDVLFEGNVKTLTPKNLTRINYDTVVYVVDNKRAALAVPISRPTTLCGQSAYETDHPRFFVVKSGKNGLFYFSKGRMNLLNMDSTTYFNTKIEFIEKRGIVEIPSLYADVLAQRCTLEQQTLRNLQTLAVTAPMEFAYAKMKKAGYMAVNHGEIIHVLQCTPVEVQIRSTDRCYHELPVIFDNRTLFMTPRSHILQKFGTEIGCNPFLYSAYKLGENWYRISQTLHEISSPQVMEPNNENKWSYTNLNDFLVEGEYTQQDMENIRSHLILPTERQAVEGIVSLTMMGLQTDLQGTTLHPLVMEKVIKTWGAQTWDSLLSWVTMFGIISSSCIGAYLLLQCLKFIVYTVVHELVFPLWDSVTMFFKKQRSGSQLATKHTKEIPVPKSKLKN